MTPPVVPSPPARISGEDVRALLLMARMGGRADRVASGQHQPGTPRERIAAALGAIAFHVPAGVARDAQVAMEAEYIDWAAKVLEAREKAFGSRGYALGHNHGVHPATDRGARLASLPQFKPVDLKALVPEPAPVQLRLVQGNKEYSRPLPQEPAARRAAALAGRDTPAGVPVTGKTETRRKPLSNLQGLLATKQHASARPAARSDFLGYGLAVTQEAAAVAAHLVAGPWRDSGTRVPSREAVQARIGEVARSLVSKVFASVCSTATRPLAAPIQHHGAAAPRTGEPPRSGAYMLQRAAPGATNDFVRQASNEAFKGSAYELGISLDRWRDNKQAQWQHATQVAQCELAELATGLQRAAVPEGSTSPAHAALAALRSLGGDSKVRVDVVQAALAELKAEPALAGADPQLLAALVQRAETVIHCMVQCDELKRWRDPLAACDSDRSR